VMSCAQKWYAEKKGLATGVIGGAVGLSGAVLTCLGRFFISRAGIRGAFLWLGALMFTVCAAACALLENPQGKAAADAQQSGARNYTAGQMLKTKQYWLLFFVVALHPGSAAVQPHYCGTWPAARPL
ncbi:MAG: MFS transporter, partial [Ruthenibacterium sp.]